MEWLHDRIRSFGREPVLATRHRVATYQDLADAVQTAIDSLKSAGVAAGDTVLLVTRYTVEGVAWLLALGTLRAVVAPVSSDVQEEIARRRDVLKPEWVVVLSGNDRASVERVAERVAGQSALDTLRKQGRAGLVIFSSGSTGQMKAMIHDFDALTEGYRRERRHRLVILGLLQFDHIGGMNTLLHALAGGLCVAVAESNTPDVVAELIEQRRINIVPVTPTFLSLVLLSGAHQQRDWSSVRIITYGAEPMPSALLQRVHDAFPSVRLLQTFGTSETGIVRSFSESSSSTRIRLDDPDVHVRVVDGELWLKSRTQVNGYLNHSSDRFTEDGWFKTGDLVETSDDGYMQIVGRTSEAINVGGQKVMPGEVESTLLQMPEVAQCVVFPEANAVMGQVVAARVVPVKSTTASTLKQKIRAYCRGRLDPFKIPVHVYIVNSLEISDRFKTNRSSTFPS